MDSEVVLQPRFALDSPYLGDYFGIWMIHDRTMLSFVERLNGTNLHVHLQSADARQSVEARDSRQYTLTRDGIAVVSIRGPMMKAVPSMADGTSTVRVRQQLRAALRDEDVRGVLLVMDTPGGTAKGNEDLAREVAAVAAKKPIFAFVEDMTASAGVSVASQATKRYANNATALYGAMGTYLVLQDESGAAEKLGVKVHVIKAGEFKGMAESGTAITEAQIAEAQRVVNRLNESYLATIASGLGRSVDSLLPLADGRVIMAADAVQQGLLHGVQTYDETYAQLVETVSRGAQQPTHARRKTVMAAETPATLAELKTTFPNSTAEWRESQLEAESTLSQAAISYAQHVEAKAAAERQKHEQELAEAKNAGSKSSSLGHAPLTRTTVGGDEFAAESGDPVEDFNAAVRARLPQHRDASFTERRAAIAYVARSKPQLHRAYLEATNSKSKRVARLIAEKFETADVN